MTRIVDGMIAARNARLDFAIAGVDAWHFELDPVHDRRMVPVGLLARSLECNPASIRLRRDQWGKPQLLSHPNVHVNISRSGSHLVAAIGSRPVGVDIEVMRPVL